MRKSANNRWNGGLRKVGDVYHYRFVSDGVVHHGSTRCETREGAEKWLKQYRTETELARVGIRSVPTLGALLSKWEVMISSVRAAKDVAIDARQIRKHFAHLLDKPVNRLSHEDIQGVIKTYMESNGCTVACNGKEIPRPHSAGGVKSLISRLDAVMNYGIKTGVLTKIPYWVMKPQVQPKGRPILSAGRIVRFLRTVDQSRNPDVRLAIRLMVGLGIREGEALAARWDWIDLDQGVYVGQGKTRQAQAIPIPEWLVDYLRQRRPTDAEGLLMPSGLADGNGDPLPHSAGFTRKAIRRAGKEVGVLRLSPHGLRATFASLHVSDAKSSVPDTQKLMVHASMTTTVKHYVQRVDTTLKAQQDRLAEVMGLAQPSTSDHDVPDYQI